MTKFKFRWTLAAFAVVALILVSVFALSGRAQADSATVYHAYLPLILNAPRPDPWIESVTMGGVESGSILVNSGESFILRVEASNRANATSGGMGSALVIGFPDNVTGELPQVTILASDVSDIITRTNPYYQVMLTDNNWEPQEHHTIEIEIGPMPVGLDTYRIYVKAVQTLTSIYESIRYVSPLDGNPGARDADGEQSQVYTAGSTYITTGIDRLNYYRSLAGVPQVSDLAYWSGGCSAHAYYMVMNGYLVHDEDPDNPYYTYEGYAAAQSSNLLGFSGIPEQDQRALWGVDVMMQTPFHGIPMLDPRLTMAGYGYSTDADSPLHYAAVLDVYRGIDYGITSTYPIYWPPADGQTPLIEYTGGETPDPLSPCGVTYSPPTGAPIWLILGDGSGEQTITAHNLTADGTAIPHCVYDYQSYTNPNPPHEADGQTLLDWYDAVVIVPRDPLEQGKTYTAYVALSTGDEYTWSFQVSPGFVNAPGGTILNLEEGE